MGDDFFGRVDDKESIAAIQSAIDHGITLVDTAPAYGSGHAEEVVGKALRGRRQDVVVATKCGIVRTKDDFVRNLKPESIRQEIDDSLRRLGTDTIDLYQIHWPDPDTPLEDTVAELLKHQQAGKFRYLGVSNFPPKLLDQIQDMSGIVSTQPQYSMLDRRIEDDVLPYAREHNLGVLSYGTLAGGILTGKYREIPSFEEGDNRAAFYDFFKEPIWTGIQTLLHEIQTIATKRGVTPAQVAINWTFQQPGITTVLVGAKRPDQAEANAAAGTWHLTKAEVETITAAIDTHVRGK
jgi:aryl-alcohol dehydrogenase-like predicted oxidoreductase